MVGSFRETLRRWSAIRLAGDIFISSAVSGAGNEARLPLELIEQIAQLPGVKRTIPYFETLASIGERSIVVGGVDLYTQCERRVYPFISGDCIPATHSWSGQAIASESAARKLGVQVGSEVTVDGKRYTVRGTFQEFGTEQPLIVIDRGDFEETYRGHHPETITVDLFHTQDLASVRAQIRELAPITTTVRNQRELLALVETLFNRTFRVTDSVRAIVFVMALLGLLSTTAQYIWERRRELRVAYVVGVSRGVIVTSLTMEVAAVAGLAVVGGVIAGVMVGWCLTSYINPLVFGWGLRFSVSVGPILEAFVFVGCVAAAMMLLARVMVGRIATSVSLADE
jgi:putative ABC transport system permease protein